MSPEAQWFKPMRMLFFSIIEARGPLILLQPVSVAKVMQILIIGLAWGLIISIYAVYCMMDGGLTGKNRWITKQEHPKKFYFLVGIILMWGIVTIIFAVREITFQ